MRGRGEYMRGRCGLLNFKNQTAEKYPHTRNCTPTFSSAVHVILVSVSVRTVTFDPVKSTILASSFSPILDIKFSENKKNNRTLK